MELTDLTTALAREMPEVLRWGGALARRIRDFNISLPGKTSGSHLTDALTLADIGVQEILVGALRDRDPVFRLARIEAEEENGDLHLFADDAPWTIALDPIDGTRQYRDKTGDGYAVMLSLRTRDTLHYSLVYLPEMGESGTWVEAIGDTIRVGPDNPLQPARDALDAITPVNPTTRPDSPQIYLIGFQEHDAARAEDVTSTGLQGVAPDDMPGSIYPLLADGRFGGSLIHSPNIYDFPVSLHIARILGGDAVWVHDGQSVNFDELWMDQRADMLRLPGIVACSANHQTLETLVKLSSEWSRERYAD
ncbi:MAG TPA: inositol monophosphatase [Planctomycetaceae bacterium]|nr:inositol monophosphatase [Planctomycetaceae bacterium]